MSKEFRQRKPGEYVQVFLKRKWLILLPTIAIATSIAWVVWRLPNVYESTTLLIVKPPTIPNALVPTLSDVDLSMRLNNVGQMVTSRSSLEPIIQQYNLYKEDREAGEPMELVVEDMRKDINVEIDKSRNDVTNAFRISFRERDPEVVRAVTSRIADKYVSAQIEQTTQGSEVTVKFFQDQLQEAQKELDDIDRRRVEYMKQNSTSLPSETQSLLAQLAALNEQQKTLITESSRNRALIATYNQQLADLKKQGEQEIIDAAETTTDPHTTPAWGELVKRKTELETELESMLTSLKEKNPDVISKRSEINKVKREMDQMDTDWKNRIEEKRQKLSTRVDPRVNTVKYNLQLAQGDLDRQTKQLEQTEQQIASLQQRINNVPSATVALEALNREYQTKKAYYDDILVKKQKAELAAGVATNAQGEGIQVIDPANLPQRPVAPKRGVLMLLGLCLGLGCGLSLAAIFEVPRLLTIQTKEDVEHYTGLPVLISVPDLLTPQEARRVPVRRAMLLAAGIVLTIVSIPTFAYILHLTRIFDRFA